MTCDSPPILCRRPKMHSQRADVAVWRRYILRCGRRTRQAPQSRPEARGTRWCLPSDPNMALKDDLIPPGIQLQAAPLPALAPQGWRLEHCKRGLRKNETTIADRYQARRDTALPI